MIQYHSLKLVQLSYCDGLQLVHGSTLMGPSIIVAIGLKYYIFCFKTTRILKGISAAKAKIRSAQDTAQATELAGIGSCITKSQVADDKNMF